MSKAIEALTRFLDDQNWRYETMDESAIRGTTSHECGRWTWFASAEPENDFLQCQGIVPMNVPSEKRALAAEYLARANWGLRIGHFNMDWSDGEVRFQTTLVLESDREPVASQLEHLVFGNRWMVGHYLPGLMAVIYGKVSPKKAAADADAEPRAQPPAEAGPEAQSAPTTANRFMPGAN